MKRIAKKLWSFIGGLNGLIFSVYLFFVIFLQLVSTFDTRNLMSGLVTEHETEKNTLIFFMYFFISIALSFLLSHFVMKIPDRAFRPKFFSGSEKPDKKQKALFFIIPFSVFLVMYIIYYPGNFGNDLIYQYNQVHSGVYNDWHPVIHTLLFIKLPLLLTFNWIGSIVLFHIILFSLTIGYSVCTVAEYTGKKAALVVLVFIIINPQTRNFFMSAEKDCTFAMLALLLTAFALRIYFTDGKWLKKISNAVIFVLIVALTTLVRHNAVLFTLPYIIAISFLISKKKAVVLTLCILVTVCAVKYPLYSAIKVEKAENRQVELLGLPMTVIGAVAANDPKVLNLDNETKEFVYKIANEDTWERQYIYGSYNSVKYAGADNDVIEEYGAKRIISMMFRCFKASPFIAIKGLVKLTEGVYSVSGNFINFRDPAYLVSIQIPIYGIKPLQKVNRFISLAQIVMFPHFFMYTGSMLLLLLAVILNKCRLNRLSDIKKLLLTLPVFIYNFGTMFLLTDTEDTGRFFYYTFIVTPLLLIIVLKNEKQVESSG